jgi:uncharacterized protein
MYSDGPALRQLTRNDCLRLLATVPIGRIIYTRQALPAVELVNFAFESGDIIIRTNRGGKLAAATRGAIVAFEADVVDPERRAGWSVTAVGPARAVSDAADIARLQEMGPDSWVPGPLEHFIRISPQLLNGRWLGAGQQASGLGGRPLRAEP